MGQRPRGPGKRVCQRVLAARRLCYSSRSQTFETRALLHVNPTSFRTAPRMPISVAFRPWTMINRVSELRSAFKNSAAPTPRPNGVRPELTKYGTPSFTTTLRGFRVDRGWLASGSLRIDQSLTKEVMSLRVREWRGGRAGMLGPPAGRRRTG